MSLHANVNNLTDCRFGSLTVIEFDAAETAAHRRPAKPGQKSTSHAYWRCLCDCGAECSVRGNKLTSGAQTSCGCKRADPSVRRAARMKLTPKRRREIAAMGGAAFLERTRS